jgi:hypothetical protein
MQVRRQRRAARVLGGYPTFIQAPQFSVGKPTSLDEISTIGGVPKWFVMGYPLLSQASRNFIAALHEFDALVTRLPNEDWALPSPCDRWDTSQLVKHVAFAAFMTIGIPVRRLAEGQRVPHSLT